MMRVMENAGYRLHAPRALLSILLLLFGLLAADAQTGVDRLPPETDDVRRAYLATALGPLSGIEAVAAGIEYSRASGLRVMVSTESNQQYRYLLFVPELEAQFAISTAGSYILRRRRSDGAVDQLKIFLRNDPGFYLRVVPAGDTRSLLTLSLADTEVYRSVPLPVTVETLLAEPFERIVEMTRARIDWARVYPAGGSLGHDEVAMMAGRARSMLHTLPDAEDGAMDEFGRLVFIESLAVQEVDPGLNCSGFAKWIVDGLHLGLHGSFLPVEQLKARHVDLRGHRWSAALEEQRDPYFGLDWTRNLATAMLSAQHGGREVHPKAADVRNVAYTTYVEDIGYRIDRLPLIMYLLASRDPGHIYLGSVNREFGDDPPLNQHVHVVVLFPYLDTKGRLHVDVMERNVETSMASLVRRYGGDAVHLVRVRADLAYTPPVIRN